MFAELCRRCQHNYGRSLEPTRKPIWKSKGMYQFGLADYTCVFSEIGVQGLSNTAWALSKLMFRDGPLISAISQASIRHHLEFVPQGLTNLAWAVASWGDLDFPLLDAIAAGSIRKLSHFNAQDCFMIAWSWAVMSMLDAHLTPYEVPDHYAALRLSGQRFPQVSSGAVGVDWIEFANGIWNVWRRAGHRHCLSRDATP